MSSVQSFFNMLIVDLLYDEVSLSLYVVSRMRSSRYIVSLASLSAIESLLMKSAFDWAYSASRTRAHIAVQDLRNCEAKTRSLYNWINSLCSAIIDFAKENDLVAVIHCVCIKINIIKRVHSIFFFVSLFYFFWIYHYSLFTLQYSLQSHIPTFFLVVWYCRHFFRWFLLSYVLES